MTFSPLRPRAGGPDRRPTPPRGLSGKPAAPRRSAPAAAPARAPPTARCCGCTCAPGPGCGSPRTARAGCSLLTRAPTARPRCSRRGGSGTGPTTTDSPARLLPRRDRPGDVGLGQPGGVLPRLPARAARRPHRRPELGRRGPADLLRGGRCGRSGAGRIARLDRAAATAARAGGAPRCSSCSRRARSSSPRGTPRRSSSRWRCPRGWPPAGALAAGRGAHRACHRGPGQRPVPRRRRGRALPRHRPRRAPLAVLPWLALPALPAALYSWYLHAHTGDWMAWKHAENRGWYRRVPRAVGGLAAHLEGRLRPHPDTGYAVEFQAELLAMAAGLLLLGVLAVRRRWPEAAYLGPQPVGAGTSLLVHVDPPGGLLWWPLWTLLAGWSLAHPGQGRVPLRRRAADHLGALTFLSGRWAG